MEEPLVELLRSLHADGTTMISVTHDQRFVERLASCVITMREGRVA
jgi:ABC-type polar amino acid transport system ATPase subunit